MWWPEALDEAIRDRPGRFDRRIEIPAPPAGACEELLRSRLGEYAEEEDVRWLSKKAAGAWVRERTGVAGGGSRESISETTSGDNDEEPTTEGAPCRTPPRS